MTMPSKMGQPREFQGTVSLWLDSRLSVVDVPSRDGALGVIGVSGMAHLINPKSIYFISK
jgi:hypothetical protein